MNNKQLWLYIVSILLSIVIFADLKIPHLFISYIIVIVVTSITTVFITIKGVIK